MPVNVFLSEGFLQSVYQQLPDARGTREDTPSLSSDDYLRFELPEITDTVLRTLGDRPAPGLHGPLVVPGILVHASAVLVRVEGDSLYLLEVEIDRGY